MADSFKDIIITPNRGSSTADPKIEFRGGNSTTDTTITIQTYPTSNGTLSFEGSSGQLFSITNDMNGTIFAVNDVSGIPSIEVLDTGAVKLAQYNGAAIVGGSAWDGTSKLQVNGNLLVTGTITETSSIVYKENIKPIENALESVLQLLGVTYDRKDGSSINEAGLIAEDVNNILPNLVKKDENGTPLGINYTKFSAYLIEAIKSLKAEIDQLKGSK